MKATLTGAQLSFIGGLILAVLIVFSVWFIFHNRYETITEQNVNKLAQAINEVCKNGATKEINFYAPQAAGFKGQLYQMAGGVGLENLAGVVLGTVDVGTDPYFYIYYESFPSDIFGIFMIAPWSEEMPWSSNILATATIDALALGMDFGFDIVAKSIKRATRYIADAGESALDVIKAGVRSKMGDELVDIIVDVKEKTVKIVKQGKELLPKTKKVGRRLALEYAASVGACYFFTDKDIEECMVYGLLGPVMIESSRYAFRKAYDEFVDWWKYHIKWKLKPEELGELLEKVGKKGDGALVEKLMDEGVIKKVREHLVVENEDYQKILTEYWISKGRPSMLGSFVFETEVGAPTKLKRIIFREREGILNKFKEAFYKIKLIIKGSEEGIYSPHALGELATRIETLQPNEFASILKNAKARGVKIAVDVNKMDEVTKFQKQVAKTLKEQADKGTLLFVEEGSGLATFLKNTDPSSLPDFGVEVHNYLTILRNPDDLKRIYGWSDSLINEEFKNFYELCTGKKTMKLADEVRSLGKKVDYILLRYQDLYTPVGASYWDLKYSPIHLGIGACPPNSLCLTSGTLAGRTIGIRMEACEANGIDVKLRRDSLTAPDPPFYLVSPCFTHLKIWKESNTVYVEPQLCKRLTLPQEFRKLPNYCFASSTLVDYYTTSEGTSFAIDLTTSVIGILCSVVTLGVGTPLCMIAMDTIGDAIAMGIDVARETMTAYPYSYNYLPVPIYEKSCEAEMVNCSKYVDKDSCVKVGCKWCSECLFNKVNKWQTDKCVDPMVDCGYSCEIGKCEALCSDNTCGSGEVCGPSSCSCISIVCGDGICSEPWENKNSCPLDC